ncbi:helix-turn-helix domain-containing protein [Actinomadura rupiterrae]|uniref:helix-turn-helix domain-containing protein n=1 Tax=Actinomadura rupiterrae TaxID=559627 RepID=UPI0020A29156|nr:helix-turn-helix domain-containing protein [Actinomadura rupiterrae]MCP2337872.1 excisionase family DNA binding protein [Actinomadura rupiterrae]
MMTARTVDTAPNLTKQLYKVAEAMEILSMGRTFIYEQMSAGRLRFVRQGTDRRIPASAIAEYVALLEREAAQEITR